MSMRDMYPSEVSAVERGRCPSCFARHKWQTLAVDRKGGCVNIQCPDCMTRFNLDVTPNRILGGEVWYVPSSYVPAEKAALVPKDDPIPVPTVEVVPELELVPLPEDRLSEPTQVKKSWWARIWDKLFSTFSHPFSLH